ncbi:MAG TPA: hypothetical protein VN495_01640 [Candidatus Paceibacterota bacterium]|nr:hypothetical protein [Candidatus Paceibacterota bacterium]
MHHRTLQDLSKFFAGLVAADLISLIWAAQSGIFPVQFLGIQFTTDIIAPGIIFDIALILILIHYGWHIGKLPRLRENTYLVISGVAFSIIAVAHLLRLFTGADITLDGWTVPLWLSWFGVLVTSFLAYSSFVLAGRSNRK